MAEEGQKEKSDTRWWDVLEKWAKRIRTIIGAVATIISVVTFSQGNRLVSYVSLFVIYLLVAGLLWCVITQKSPLQWAASIVLPSSVPYRAELRFRYSKRQRWIAMAGLAVLTLFTFGWIGVTGWQDIQCWRAVVASRGQLKLIGVNVVQVIQRWCPLPMEPAQVDEILIIVSQFESASGEGGIEFAKRIVKDLEDADIEGMSIERLPPNRIIRNEKEAKALGEITKATLVIWGWVDEVGAAPHYEVIPEQIKQVKLERIRSELDSFDIWVDRELPRGMLYLTKFTIGQVYYLRDQYDEALTYFNEALSALPQEKTSSWGEEYVYFYRGVTQANLGWWSRAMIDYQQAIQRNDEFAEAYNNLGVAFSGLRDYERAIEDFTLAINLGLNVAYYNRGNAYYNQGRFACLAGQYDEALDYLNLAIEDYTRAIGRLDQDSIYAAYYNRGLAHAASQNHDAAIEDYSKVIEDLAADEEARVEALTARGVAYTRLGQYSEALEDYGEALRLNPKYALAHYNLAANKALEGDTEGAIEALLEAIKLDPELEASAACDSDFDSIKEELPDLVPPPEGCPPAPCR